MLKRYPRALLKIYVFNLIIVNSLSKVKGEKCKSALISPQDDEFKTCICEGKIGRCYALIKSPETWDKAKGKCEDRSAYLAEISTKKQAEAIERFQNDIEEWKGRDGHLWLGGNNRNTGSNQEKQNGTWIWSKTQRKIPFSRTIYGPEYGCDPCCATFFGTCMKCCSGPVPWRKAGHCLGFESVFEDGKRARRGSLKTADCNSESFYVCEKLSSPPDEGSTGIAKRASVLPIVIVTLTVALP